MNNMKKKFLFITIALLTLLINTDMVKAEDYSSYCTKNPTAPMCVCLAKADGVVRGDTQFEFTYCYHLYCKQSSNTYESRTLSLSSLSGPFCSNGNLYPKKTPKSTSYDNYIGKTCGLEPDIYYNQTVIVDCTRKSDGSAYVSPTTKKTTIPVIPTTNFNPNTTKAPTTTTKKTTTTTKKQTSQRVTFETIPVETTTKAPTTEPEVTISSTTIKKITINGIDTKYKSSKSLYDLKVPYGMSEVEVEVTLEDETSQVIVIGNTDMPDDEEHSIHIVVTARNGETREVTFNIIRYTTLSNDCSLANIYSENYNFDFAKNKKDYTLKVEKNVSSIDFEIIPTDEENATFTVNGNEKLRNKSVITIDVIAEDGSSCLYTIKIKKDSNTWKYILAIVLLVGVLATSSILLYRYLKKSKGKYKYE